MTKQEKIIVSAYTGVLMCDFADLQEYIEKKFGRPVFTHELADEGMLAEIKKKTKEEFLEICNREEPEQKKGHWIDIDDYFNRISGKCSVCGWQAHLYEDDVVGMNFCPNCGARMVKEDEEHD